MTEFVYVKPHSRSRTLTLSQVAQVANCLKQGALAVLPTETGYMLAALATSGDAVKSAFTVKGRAGCCCTRATSPRPPPEQAWKS